MTTQHHISIDGIPIGNDLTMVLIAGPCAIESLDHAIDMATALDLMAKELGIGFIYKSSFDKLTVRQSIRIVALVLIRVWPFWLR